MISLLIPSLGIAAQVQTGSPDRWQRKDWFYIEREAQEIMMETPYKYPHADIIGAHDYREFKDLHKIKTNALIIYNQKRYRVKFTEIVEATDTRVLTETGLHLFTCYGKKRFVVHSK